MLRKKWSELGKLAFLGFLGIDISNGDTLFAALIPLPGHSEKFAAVIVCTAPCYSFLNIFWVGVRPASSSSLWGTEKAGWC
jgi:hypothetical protein